MGLSAVCDCGGRGASIKQVRYIQGRIHCVDDPIWEYCLGLLFFGTCIQVRKYTKVMSFKKKKNTENL